jgi:hypothetical protein
MEKTYKPLESSELYRKINALNLTPSGREHALATLALAETLVDAWVNTVSWLAAKLTQASPAAPANRAAVSGKLTHQ